VAPLEFAAIYAAVREAWPRAVWLGVVAVYALGVPLVLGLRAGGRW
jgi:DHA1 family tetracycline resistance protein-like MFS transporter